MYRLSQKHATYAHMGASPCWHPVFKQFPDALQFHGILYYDDIEVASPLRAKAGLQLGNI